MRGELSCGPAESIAWSDLRSPANGRPLDAPVVMPGLTVVKGDTSSGNEAEARIGRAFDLATDKTVAETRLPVRAGRAREVKVAGGTTLVITLESDAYGVTSLLFGPVVRLARTSSGSEVAELIAPRPPEARPGAAFYLSESTRVRIALDDRHGTLQPGARLHGSIPGLGAIDRRLSPPPDPPPNTADGALRFLVAHGLAVGLPIASIALSYLEENPECVTLCTPGGQILPADRDYIAELSERSAEEIQSYRAQVELFEALTYGVSLATIFIPTARRGSLDRWELLEDALVIGEGALVGATTPLWLQSRLGRARPIVFHPTASPGTTGRDAITAPFLAPRTTIAVAAASSAVTLLFFEEAGEGWIVPAMLALGALTTAVGFAEVRSGAVYPSDIPFGAFEGFVAGAGVVFWNHIFWRGWPVDPDRGGLPLRVRGLDLRVHEDGASFGARGTF